MASVTSAATTIFDNNVEPRFEELRTIRKNISAAVTNFVNEWRSISSIPRDQWESDDVFDRIQDVDAKRQEIAINVKHWISTAHGSLDVHNEGDQVMLLKMAGYVDRVRKHLADHPFLNVSDAEAEERVRLPEKGDIIKPKELSHGQKRAFGDVSLLPSMQPSKLLRQKNPLINISDDDYEDTHSEMQITPNAPPPLNYVPAYLEEPAPIVMRPPTSRQPRASLSGALNKRPRSISPNQAARRAEIQAEAEALAKNMQMLKEAQTFAQQQQEEKTKMLREMEVMRKELATREREAAERRQQEIEEKERAARLEAQEARRQAQTAKAKAVEEEIAKMHASIKASATEMQQMREILNGKAPLDPAPEVMDADAAAAADLFQFPKRRSKRPSPKMPVVQHQQQQLHQPSDDVEIEMEVDVGNPTAPSQLNIPVAHIGSSAIAAEAGLRQRQLAAQHAKEARPAKKFASGSSLEYRNVMARFDMAVKSPGMDSRMKLLEMMHWFAGNAGDVVDCYAASRDSDLAYATVRSELDSLYGATSDSVVPLIRQLASGKAISEFDHDGHLTLYTKLIFAEATAREVGQMDQLNRRDNIADIAENRVKHIAKKVWELDAKLKRKHGRHIDFADFKGIVHEWVGILSTRKTLMAPPVVKVNVTEVVNAPQKSQTSRQIRKEKESFSSAVKEGAKKQQPSSKCNFCGSVHATEDCATFANLSVDERAKKIQQLRLCYHCFESGHISRNCDAKPTCLKCQKRHHTLLHGQKPPSTLNTHVNAQTSTLNADAAAFQGRTGSTEAPVNRGAASLIPVPPLNSVVDESTANPGNLMLA